MVSKINPLLKRKHINLSYSSTDELPKVNIDDQQNEQVIENLLGNALKYTPEHGEIGINLAMHSNEKTYAKISISDNGKGDSRGGSAKNIRQVSSY